MEVCICSRDHWQEFISGPDPSVYLHINLSGDRQVKTVDEFLPYCKQVISLNLSHTNLRTLEHLKDFTNLKYLNVARTNILDPELLHLHDMKLEELYLGGNDLFDVHALESLTSLKKLSLSCTRVYNLQPLCMMENLEYLDLYSTLVDRLSQLSPLNNLKELDVRRCPVTTCWIRIKFPSLKLIA